MPKRTGKTQLLEQLLQKGIIDIVSAKTDKEASNALCETVFDVCLVHQYRYSNPRIFVPKSSDWYENVLPEYDDFRFKTCLRVTRQKFHEILHLIKDNDIFCHKFKLPNAMIPVELQLAITLFRFGSSGSGTSCMKVGQHFGVSDSGNIVRCTERVIQAVLSLKNKYIHWPTDEERNLIVKNMEKKLPGCIGYIDGSHINLFEAPLEDHESYYSRKQKYGIHIQAVCDEHLVIRNVFLGYPASVHDARVYANSAIGISPETFLSEGQWLAGDSAYKLTKYLLTPYRDNATAGTATQRKIFNRYFSSYRVKIEQTFGILKAQFQSLKELRIRVDKATGHRRACEWIMTACILYNILRPSGDGEINVDQCEVDEANETENATAVGEEKRQELFRWIHGIE